MFIEKRIMSIFQETGAILKGHFVYTSGRHGEVYVNKDAIYPYDHIHSLCRSLADDLPEKNFFDTEAVLAPVFGGIVLSRLIADALMERFEVTEALAIYAEKTDDKRGFVFRRGYDKLIAGKKVLVVDDIMTTGGSVKKVIEAARLCGAEILGVAVLWNRGEITAEMLGVPHLYSLVEKQFESWDEADCPLCKQGVPINADVGHGREFLTQKALEDVVRAANMASAEVFGGKKK